MYLLTQDVGFNTRHTPMEHALTDIRLDEEYAKFYMEYSGQRKLPPPLDGRTLYQELQQRLGHAAQQQLMNAAAAGLQSAASGRPGKDRKLCGKYHGISVGNRLQLLNKS